MQGPALAGVLHTVRKGFVPVEIEQSIDGGFRRKFVRHQKIGKILHQNPFVFRWVERAFTALASARNDKIRYEKKLRFQNLAAGGRPVSEYGGGGDKYGDLKSALAYASELQNRDFGENWLSESPALYKKQTESLSALAERQSAGYFYNFGACYAHVDAALARMFPDASFTGTDLSEYNAAFNRRAFSDVKNLDVRCGDFFTHGPVENERAVFWHSRTFCLLPASFVKKAYQHAHKCGFKYIAGFEQNGLSEQTWAPYVFSKNEKDSVYWRDGMFIHNYPGILESCGYRVRDAGLFKTGHASPDYRILYFTAERAE